MGVIIEFPGNAVSRPSHGADRSGRPGEIVILPVIRIERFDSAVVVDQGTDDPGPEAATPRRRRRRRS